MAGDGRAGWACAGFSFFRSGRLRNGAGAGNMGVWVVLTWRDGSKAHNVLSYSGAAWGGLVERRWSCE